MVLRTFSFILLICTFAFTARAFDFAPTCDTSMIVDSVSTYLHSQVDAILAKASEESCEAAFVENKCEDLKRTLTVDQQADIIDCKKMLTNIESNAMMAVGCAEGGLSFVVDTVKTFASLPGAIVPTAKISWRT